MVRQEASKPGKAVESAGRPEVAAPFSWVPTSAVAARLPCRVRRVVRLPGGRPAQRHPPVPGCSQGGPVPHQGALAVHDRDRLCVCQALPYARRRERRQVCRLPLRLHPAHLPNHHGGADDGVGILSMSCISCWQAAKLALCRATQQQHTRWAGGGPGCGSWSRHGAVPAWWWQPILAAALWSPAPFRA
jgi:hypothetical protein